MRSKKREPAERGQATVLMHHPYSRVRQRTQFLFAGRPNYRVLSKRIEGVAPANVETRRLPPLRALQYPGLYGPLSAASRASLAADSRGGETWVITHEAQFDMVPRGRRVILDFHDDNAAFYKGGRTRAFFEACQRRALAGADRIVCSSGVLRDKVLDLSGRRADLIENGFETSFVRSLARPDSRVAVYFGTVDWWFDLSLVETLLAEGFEVRIIGPVNPHVELPDHTGLKRLGVQPHAALPDLTDDAALLILPFKPSELVSAVNPVKLYEYVALGRPILTSYWPELAQFEGLAEFYRAGDDLKARIDAALAMRVEPAARDRFLAANSWESRRVAMDAVVFGEAVA